tara:strand:+ start:2592 stop:2882 length:291 start_codon:yes stop_codon:yes gene_type:complete
VGKNIKRGLIKNPMIDYIGGMKTLILLTAAVLVAVTPFFFKHDRIRSDSLKNLHRFNKRLEKRPLRRTLPYPMLPDMRNVANSHVPTSSLAARRFT